MGRVITPLLLANERIEPFQEDVQPMETGGDPPSVGRVEAKLEKMSINDEAEKTAKGPANSLKVKRNMMQMKKLDSANYDLFSVGVLHAIFAYIDYNSIKLPDSAQYNVIGHFAVVIYEVLVL